MSDPQHPEQVPAFGRERPLVYEWVGEFVIVGHVEGPGLSEENMLKRVSGQLETMSGAYLLREVSALGVVVRRVLEGEGKEDLEYSSSRFIPWSAIQYIQGLPKDEDEKEEE